MPNIQTRIENHKISKFNQQLNELRATENFVEAYKKIIRIKSKIKFHTEAIQNLKKKMK